MSDFDEVLERVLADPAFQAALRRDPDAALAGFTLAPDERQLLQAQLDLGAGPERTVEMRVSKSGVMGMVGPVVSAFGLTGVPDGVSTFGEVPQDENFGVSTTLGSADTGVFGEVDHSAGTPAVDYHTWVDADGDGSGDAYQAIERGDGGVDLSVDTDHDGVVDFVGHDYDRDGLVDNADLDTDGDGVLDTRLSDDDGDGWMDSSAAMPAADHATFGQAPASN